MKIKLSTPESLGWIFFLILMLLLLFPCLYASWKLTYHDTERSTVAGLGIGAAAFISAITTTVGNTLLQRRQKQVKETERKKAKKRK